MSYSTFRHKFITWWLVNKRQKEEGFSLIESLVAIVVLFIAFTINLQFIVTLKIQNLKQEIQTAAVSASKEIMDDIRYQLQTDLNNYTQGNSQLSNLTSAGYTFNAEVYVCKAKPTITNNNVTSCTSSGSADIRYIVVQVIDGGRKNEKLYTVESVFTKLQ